MVRDESHDPFAICGRQLAPVSASPSDSRSIQSRPSGLSITSTIDGSSRNRAMAGPRAVRSMRAPRVIASDFW